MPNRKLSDEERARIIPLLDEVRSRLKELARNDTSLEWALRRYIYIRLHNDERENPAKRQSLKTKQRRNQQGLCKVCNQPLPLKGSVLDRLDAMKGYTEGNTRLLCPSCDRAIQERRHYT